MDKEKELCFEDEDVVTLITNDGREIKFIEIAGIAYNSGFYAILQPVELIEGMSDDAALVFRVFASRDGNDTFELELNYDIINAVFEEYYRLYDECHKNED